MYPYVRNPRVLGLGEVMDDPGVINGDESMFSKLLLFETGRLTDMPLICRTGS